MTRLSRPRRFALAGVCAAAIGAGGMVLPATAFALPMDCGMQTQESCFGSPGGTGMIPPATVPIEGPYFDPRPVCLYDRELRRTVCEKDGPPPQP